MKKVILKTLYKKLLSKIYNPFIYTNIKPMTLEIKPEDKCLVIAPHPDDESIGCGGIINLYPKNFDVICLTHGEENSERAEEFKAAMEFAGVNNYKHLCLDDKKILSGYEMFKNIDISEYDYIFIPYIFDQHRDHKAVSILLNRLLNETKNYKKNMQIAYYEVWSTINMPQCYVDITSVVDKKINMINLHKCQVAKKDYAEKIIGLNRYRGLLKDIEAVESYSIMNVKDFDKVVTTLCE